MDEAANIAPVRNLASWLSQCGDHGIVIATIWQSIAQIDQRYGRAARDAICAASTAQLFIPPLAEPTSAGYLSELLGEEPVANASAGPSHRSARGQPPEGRARAVAAPGPSRPRDPDLPRPAARDRARAGLVRGPALRRPCRALESGSERPGARRPRSRWPPRRASRPDTVMSEHDSPSPRHAQRRRAHARGA